MPEEAGERRELPMVFCAELRDFAQVLSNGVIDLAITAHALKALNVDEYGLDEMDNRILSCIIEKFKGGPVGITTIATAVGEETGTLEEVYEPFLIQEGFLMRTPRGREATPKAYKHLGKQPHSHSRGPGLVRLLIMNNYYHPCNKNITGFLCKSIVSFFHSAMVFVLIHSFGEVSSDAIHSCVDALQFCKTVSNNLLFL